MSSVFTLEPREGYLYVHLEPGFEMTPDSTAAVWTAICEGCQERGLRRALAVGDGVTRRLTTSETFDIGSDTGTGVNDADYQTPFAFNGTLNSLTLKLLPPG